jgi:hypothetical protein
VRIDLHPKARVEVRRRTGKPAPNHLECGGRATNGRRKDGRAPTGGAATIGRRGSKTQRRRRFGSSLATFADLVEIPRHRDPRTPEPKTRNRELGTVNWEPRTPEPRTPEPWNPGPAEVPKGGCRSQSGVAGPVLFGRPTRRARRGPLPPHSKRSAASSQRAAASGQIGDAKPQTPELGTGNCEPETANPGTPEPRNLGR